MASNAENISIWWRHHVCLFYIQPLILAILQQGWKSTFQPFAFCLVINCMTGNIKFDSQPFSSRYMIFLYIVIKMKRMSRSQTCHLSPGHTVPIWRSRSLRSEKSWTSAWSAHEVVATSYWYLGSLLGRETIFSDREASTTKFYCKTLSCWSWLWLRSIHGSISVVCGIGHVVGLSYPAWGHWWKACGHLWTA